MSELTGPVIPDETHFNGTKENNPGQLEPFSGPEYLELKKRGATMEDIPRLLLTIEFLGASCKALNEQHASNVDVINTLRPVCVMFAMNGGGKIMIPFENMAVAAQQDLHWNANKATKFLELWVKVKPPKGIIIPGDFRR
ncbi:MAG: hypothetical protein WC100_03520 [Sterolibacterium sp.]